VIGLLERAAGFARDDDPPCKLAKLEALLAQATADVAATAPLLAALLSIPTGERYPSRASARSGRRSARSRPSWSSWPAWLATARC
jgi:hypothetical protein